VLINDNEEAMKQGNEALNASSLLFLRSVKRFIATIFYSALNVSLPLIFKRNQIIVKRFIAFTFLKGFIA
jgi:hypothetical protein